MTTETTPILNGSAPELRERFHAARQQGKRAKDAA